MGGADCMITYTTHVYIEGYMSFQSLISDISCILHQQMGSISIMPKKPHEDFITNMDSMKIVNANEHVFIRGLYLNFLNS